MEMQTIQTIYDDGNSLFSNNVNLTNDTTLAYLFPYLTRLDLWIEESGGERELLIKFINKDTFEYDLQKLYKAVWAWCTAYSFKYKKLLDINDLQYDFKEGFKKIEALGATEKVVNYGENAATNVQGERVTSDVIGAMSSETLGQTTAFDSVIMKDNEKNVSTIPEHTNTITNETVTDTITKDAHTDVTNTKESENMVTGHNEPITNLIEKEWKMANKSAIDVIVSEILNFITYSILL